MNAMACTFMGAGYENPTLYQNCKRKFLNIDNIHVMRAAWSKLKQTLQEESGPSVEAKALQAIAPSAHPVLSLRHLLCRGTTTSRCCWARPLKPLATSWPARL